MIKRPRDLKRLHVIQQVVRTLVDNGHINDHGVQTEIARHFNVSRQRVHQVVVSMRNRNDQAQS